jgi:phage antirepressor YoqD-like protein
MTNEQIHILKSSQTSMIDTATTNFYGKDLLTAQIMKEVYVAMKPIVEGVGLDWKGQSKKISVSSRYGHIKIPLQTAGGIQEMLCIPLKKLNGWLFSVNPQKVRPEIRNTVIRYQEECFQTLHEYWIKGSSENPRANTNLITIDPAQNQPEVLQLLADKSKQLKVQEPLVAIANNFLESSTLKTTLQVSKELGIGEKILFKILREEKIFYYTWQNGKRVNLPYERHITAGRFEVKNKTVEYKKSDGTIARVNYSQVRFTAKGQAFTSALLKKRNERSAMIARDRFFEHHGQTAVAQ